MNSTRLRWWAAWLGFGCLEAMAAPPLLQIADLMHTAPIRQIRVDPGLQRLYTVSADKTLRAWQLPDLAPAGEVHVPAAMGNEGDLQSLAVDPVGHRVAIGGHTGLSQGGKACVHLHDGQSLRLRKSHCAFDSIITALSFSPDGQTLLVGLGDRAGLHRLDLRNGQVTVQDKAYAGPVSFIDHASDGRAVVAAHDGHLRLYQGNGTLHHRRRLISPHSSPLLGGARFSPDGRWIAVGHVDEPVLEMLDAKSFQTLSLNRVADADQKGLCCIAFSHDGQFVYANGHHSHDDRTPLYRAPLQATLALQPWARGHQSFSNMAPLSGGGMVVSTMAPSLIMLDDNGQVKGTRMPPTADFREGAGTFASNADGSMLRLPMQFGGAAPVVFDLRHASAPLLLEDAPIQPPVPPMQPSRAALKPGLTWVADRRQALLNGQALAMDTNEQMLSATNSPDGRTWVLGSHWNLRWYNSQGQLLRSRFTSGAVHNLLVTPDGSKLVATLGDGTVRWHDMATGDEIMALFVHSNRKDWVLWRPDGHYASSDEGDRYVGWLFNRGPDAEPDFFRAVQFERSFYRPDLIGDRWHGKPMVSAGFTPKLPPRLQITPTRLAAPPDGPARYRLQVEAQALGEPMQDMVLYVNDRPVTPARDRPLPIAQQQRTQREFVIDASEPETRLRLEVSTRGNSGVLGVAEARLPGTPGAQQADGRGTLRILAVGVNAFPRLVPPAWPGPDLTLGVAAADAQAMASTLPQANLGLYQNVHVEVLTDQGPRLPDKASILAALQRLSDSGPDDTTIVFMASHGISDKRGNYFFVPRDAQPIDVKAVLQGAPVPGAVNSLLGWQDIFDALRQASGRRLLIVDTCEARNLAGEHQAHSLRKRSAAAQFALSLAAQGNESSQELDTLGHGVFTWGMLQALREPSHGGPAAMLTLEQVFEHARHVVQTQRPLADKPQTPHLIAPPTLRAMPLRNAGLILHQSRN